MGIKIGPLVCGYCGEKAGFAAEENILWAVCPNGHKWQPGFGGLCAAVENAGEMMEAPEGALNDTLQEKGIPACFGNIEPRMRVSLDGSENLPPTFNSAEEAFAHMIMDAIDDAKEHGCNLVHCARCDLFERCRVLSGL